MAITNAAFAMVHPKAVVRYNVMKGTTIVPLRLMSITKDNHHMAGDKPVYALRYKDVIDFMLPRANI
jgi:hypothetical protein